MAAGPVGGVAAYHQTEGHRRGLVPGVDWHEDLQGRVAVEDDVLEDVPPPLRDQVLDADVLDAFLVGLAHRVAQVHPAEPCLHRKGRVPGGQPRVYDLEDHAVAYHRHVHVGGRDEAGAAVEAHRVQIPEGLIELVPVIGLRLEGLLDDGNDHAVVAVLGLGRVVDDIETDVLAHEDRVGLEGAPAALVAAPRVRFAGVLPGVPETYDASAAVPAVHDLQPQQGPLVQVRHRVRKVGRIHRRVTRLLRIVRHDLRGREVGPFLVDVYVVARRGHVRSDAVGSDVVGAPVQAPALVEAVLVGHPGVHHRIDRGNIMLRRGLENAVVIL